MLSGPHRCDELHTQNSRALWEELRTSALLAARRPALVWRLSVVPSQAATLAETLRQSFAVAVGPEVTMDWGGGQLWLLLGAKDLPADGGAKLIRSAIASHGGGHATLLLAPEALRRVVPVFQPQPAPLAALNQRIKQNLDPGGVFTPHRMTLPH
jgi:glycolate oxidase FAD binding subunit